VSVLQPTPFEPIAIVGMSCLFPKAGDTEAYWNLLLNGVDAIGPIPPTHWRPEDYFDTDPKKPDHTYAQTGGFIDPVDYPPLDFGVAPNALPAIDTTQLLGLWVARAALRDAGLADATEAQRRRVSVILGVTGTLELVIPLGARLGHPHWKRAMREVGIPDDQAAKVVERIGQAYVPWQEDSFPGLLGNVVAGRIANRLNLGGTNCVVDAACASSLSAIHLAALELGTGRADVVVTGGMDTFNDIFMYMCFSKTPALSPTGHARPFDHRGDGTILGEGLGCVILKRLTDAEQAGDRVYAVLRGLGSSSDGKGQAIYAPSPAGQARALREAYELAGLSPATIELVEAHGTGTRAGDLAEITALQEVYRASGRTGSWCALGSVKSQIGHTKAAAGAAGLMKAALALYHRVQPPTLKVERPLEPLLAADSPFRVNTEPRPWVAADHPRRAAVSAFGFGGSNFHAVLEEYPVSRREIAWDPDVQLVTFSGDSIESLIEQIDAWCDAVPTAFREASAATRRAFCADRPFRAGFCVPRGALDVTALRQQLRPWLSPSDPAPNLRVGPLTAFLGRGRPAGQIALLFPGQGSQYVGMLRELACRFPAMHDALAAANEFAGKPRLSDTIYPFTAFTDAERQAQEAELRATTNAQPALAAVGWGLAQILRDFGVRPDAVAGHSFGELTALATAGVLAPTTLFTLARRRGELLRDHGNPAGSMLAVGADAASVRRWLECSRAPVTIANCNSPRQVVLSGPRAELDRLLPRLQEQGWTATLLPVSGAFHSADLAPASDAFEKELANVSWQKAAVPVYSNVSGAVYPTHADAARRLLAQQLSQPVEWQRLIETMHAAGVRIFVEVGPKAVLTNTVAATLGERPHAAIALDASAGKQRGLIELGNALARLAVLGLPVRVSEWDPAAPTAAAAKPAFTVKVGGANLPPPVASAEPTTSRPRAAVAATPPPPKIPQTVSPPTAATSPMSANVPTQKTMKPTSPPAADFLAVLQQITQQTAEVHRLFLEGQERSLAVLQHWLTGEAVPPVPPRPALPPVAPPPLAATNGHAKPLAAPPPPSPRPEPTARQAQPAAVMPPPRIQAPSKASPVPLTNGASIHHGPAHHGPANVLLKIVSEKTGYPVEMLGLDMDLDTDLGIDSIKRVEIFSAVQEHLPSAPAIKAEHLGSFHKLRDVVQFLDGASPPPAPAQPRHAQPLPQTHPVEPTDGAARQLLLDVVSEKTGYPVEMLGLDMHLDADLGIDSIKRVEIFSTLQERLPTAPAIKAEHLGRLQTLNDVVEFLTGAGGPPHLNGANGQGRGESGSTRLEKKKSPARRLIRYAPRLRTTPPMPPGARDPDLAAARLGVTLDGSDLAPAVVRELSRRGISATLLDLHGAQTQELPHDLTGLLLLMPANTTTDDLTAAFAWVQRVGPQLKSTACATTPRLVSISRFDGGFGLCNGRLGSPLSAAIGGLVKTAAREWPKVACRCLDVAADLTDTAAIAVRIVDELSQPGAVEVGLSGSGRAELILEKADADVGTEAPPIAPGDVVVVTGGARGVTAAATLAMAQACQPTLVILGRTELAEVESPAFESLGDAAALKAELIRRANGQATPRSIEQQLRRILQQREIRATLDALRRAGSTVEYHAVDVLDAAAVAQLLGNVRRRLGPVRGIVHGAGVLADRWIEDKTLEQFFDVVATKITGLQNLLTGINPEDLRWLALFSSTTARLGRVGQADYAVANEGLNKWAHRAAAVWPHVRVSALGWGPWEGGMVTPDLAKLFHQEGVGLIPLDAGAAFLLEELARPRPTEVEIVVTQGELPLNEPPPVAKPASACTGNKEVSVAGLPILADHVLNGKATVPLALAVHWLAEAGMHQLPGQTLRRVSQVRVLKGIVLGAEESRMVAIHAGPKTRSADAWSVAAEISSHGVQGQRMPHFVATLQAGLAEPAAGPPPPRLAPRSGSPTACYGNALFHGPAWHMLRRWIGQSEMDLAAEAALAPPPTVWLPDAVRSAWLIDPFALDAVLQLMIVWNHERYGLPSLPTSIQEIRIVGPRPADDVAVVQIAVRETSNRRCVADAWVVDTQGQAYLELHGVEHTLDAGLAAAFARSQLATLAPATA
jgi:acyl transferase domain-containing protein/NAD(P)-dependent dehydrogenase (short-subunit alcohol dehydrogenase family)/acyl carrier protein